jgi:predicted O-methyltransferase YrrM
VKDLETAAARLYDKVAPLMPGWLSGAIDYQQERYENPWGGPFNGQVRRQQMFMSLIRAVEPRAIVECGTYRGTTTAFMAESTRLPVWTVEKNSRFYHYARLRLKRHSSIHVVRDDSRHFLGELATNGVVATDDTTLFYLDSHWQDDLPLRAEVSFILGHWNSCVIMIDDFLVPDDPGYRYDDYRAHGRICRDYLLPVLRDDTVGFVPSVRSDDETGARRGCGIFVPASLAPALGGVKELRRMSLS